MPSKESLRLEADIHAMLQVWREAEKYAAQKKQQHYRACLVQIVECAVAAMTGPQDRILTVLAILTLLLGTIHIKFVSGMSQRGTGVVTLLVAHWVWISECSTLGYSAFLFPYWLDHLPVGIFCLGHRLQYCSIPVLAKEIFFAMIVWFVKKRIW